MLIATVAALGLVVYHPIIYAVPGMCIGLIGWGRLLADVIWNGWL